MHTTVCEIASQQEPTEYPSELGSVPYDGQTVRWGWTRGRLKERTCVYLQMVYVVVQRKPTHCKVTILQLKTFF